MTILEALRLVFGVLFLAFGLFIFISAVVGNYRFHSDSGFMHFLNK